ncbi:MAG: hypothetical protein R3A48_27865, partial [Polyangiales bacterium]
RRFEAMPPADTRLTLIPLTLLALLLVFFEVGASVFGWGVLCVIVGALSGLAAILALACAAFASVVALIPWAAFGPEFVDPARVMARGFDAAAWLFALWARLAGRAFGAHVRFELTPTVEVGLALLAGCAVAWFALRAHARLRARSRP